MRMQLCSVSNERSGYLLTLDPTLKQYFKQNKKQLLLGNYLGLH